LAGGDLDLPVHDWILIVDDEFDVVTSLKMGEND